MNSIFINTESLAYTPKLVGKPISPLLGLSGEGDLLSVFIPADSKTTNGEIFLGKNGTTDLYKTLHSDGTVSVHPYVDNQEVYGEPLGEGVEAIKLVFQTDAPISFHAQLPVPTEVIPQDFLNQAEYENEVRTFLKLVQDKLEIIQGEPNHFIVSLSDLENSPKVLSVEKVPDLKAELGKSATAEYLEYYDANFPWSTVEALFNNFMEASIEYKGSRRKLSFREYLNLKVLGSTPKEIFLQMLVQAITFKLLNDREGNYFEDISLYLPMTESSSVEEVRPLIVIKEQGQVFVLKLDKVREAISFESLTSFTRYLNEDQGYSHVLRVDLSLECIEEVLAYIRGRDQAATTLEDLVRILADSTKSEEKLQEEVLLIEAVTAQEKSARPKIEKLMKQVFNSLDKTGLNTKRYQEELFSLDDTGFFRYIKKLLSSPRNNLELQVLPGKNEPNLEDIKEALAILKVPEAEYVYMRHEGNKDNPLRSRYRQTVGYIHIRRLQQLLSKKNTYSLSIKQRNLKNNQVTGHDAIARISDLEVNALKAINADATLRELMGPRADSSDMKTDLYTQISTYGYAELDSMEGSLSNKRTLN